MRLLSQSTKPRIRNTERVILKQFGQGAFHTQHTPSPSSACLFETDPQAVMPKATMSSCSEEAAVIRYS